MHQESNYNYTEKKKKIKLTEKIVNFGVSGKPFILQKISNFY